MSWPTDTVTNVHMDQSTDDPSLARAELKNALDILKLILAEVTAGATIWHSSNLPKASSGTKLDNFPSTTTFMTFQQTTAPTGWAKQTSHNNKAFRVVSGTASSGGSSAFTTAFAASRAASAEYLSQSQVALMAHTHKMFVGASGSSVLRDNPTYQATTEYNDGSYNNVVMGASTGTPTHGDTGAIGGSGSIATHNHTLDMAVQYVDLIIAKKS